ncbi:hypothetical protein GCM10027341_24790 [Spirosoma knui]
MAHPKRTVNNQTSLDFKHYTIMFPTFTTLIGSILLSAATLMNPTNPKALSFNTSAFVTVNNQIRLSVTKAVDTPVVILLRNQQNEVLYQQKLGKKHENYAILFHLNDLTDGEYEIEVKSAEGSIRKQLKIATAPVQETARLVAIQ